MSSSTTSDVLTLASSAEVDALVGSAEALTEYLQQVTLEHSLLLESLTSLTASILPDLQENMEGLLSAAGRLESIFERVDLLERRMDSIHQLLIHLNDTVRQMERPANVKERATNFFRSIGFKSENQEMWRRIPSHIMVHGDCPAVFLEKVKTAIRSSE